MGLLLTAFKLISNILCILFSFHISNNMYLFSFQHTINVKCRRNITQTHAAMVVKYTLINEQNVFYLLVLTKIKKYANEKEIYKFARKSALYSLLGRHGRQRNMSVNQRQWFRALHFSITLPFIFDTSLPQITTTGSYKETVKFVLAAL